MIAIIGAFGRLTDAGMDEEEATETVLRILQESDPGGRPSAPRSSVPVIDTITEEREGHRLRRDLAVRSYRLRKAPRTTARYLLKFL
jgi:hypothetical protein